MILKWIFKAWDGETWTFNLGQGRDRWRALVNAVMNFWFRKMWGIPFPAQDLLASREGLCFVELVSWLVGWLVGWFVGQSVVDALRHVSPNYGQTPYPNSPKLCAWKFPYLYLRQISINVPVVTGQVYFWDPLVLSAVMLLKYILWGYRCRFL